MNQAEQLALTLIQTKVKEEGKAVTSRRRFTQLNPNVSQNSMKAFKQIIELLVDEKFESIQVTRTTELN